MKLRKPIKVFAVLFAATLSMVGAICLSLYHDFPTYSGSIAAERVRAEFGKESSNNYFAMNGLGLGSYDVYYRFIARPNDIEEYLARKQLNEVPSTSGGINKFIVAPPYWWIPRIDEETRFFGITNPAFPYLDVVFMSWNSQSGLCHIHLVGG